MTRRDLAILVLFFWSGCAGLIYEMVWLRELRLLFGSATFASSAALAAFFLGLGCGGFFWGRRSEQAARPLRTFACLELAIAACSMASLLIIPAYRALLPGLLDEQWPHAALLSLKFILALALLFPPAFFMGGTLPLVAQTFRNRGTQQGRYIAAAYAANTTGGVAGACAAGFILPPWLGYDGTFHAALVLSISVGAIALALSIHTAPVPDQTGSKDAPEQAPQPFTTLSPRIALMLAAFSGFTALALEVLWVRMFEQVLQNSQYTFGTILVSFLLALALGSWGARLGLSRHTEPLHALFWMLLFSGALTACGPRAFFFFTDGMNYIRPNASLGRYILQVMLIALPCVLLPCACMGLIFPYVLGVNTSRAPGAAAGRLAGWNTIGAVLGPLVAGQLLLPYLGLWHAIGFLALAYCSAALWLGWRARLQASFKLLPIATAAILAGMAWLAPLPPVRLGEGETLLAAWEGRLATVTVIREPGDLGIHVNNFYKLGGTRSERFEMRQAHLPLLLHPRPKHVFFLGMGTGLTAAGAIRHDVESIRICELLPEVIEASRLHFAPHLNGLFEDPRVQVIPEDGRHYLHATRRRFDLIIADLFVPWEAGAGNLYSLEHYRTSFDRLEPGGLYAQWLPLYQVSEREFAIIARTMLEVFPRVTLWRGDFLPRRSIALLLGHRDTQPLNLGPGAERLRAMSAEDLRANLRPDGALPGARPWPEHLNPLLPFYCGTLDAAAEPFASAALQTDRAPLLDFLAPATHLRVQTRQAEWFSGLPFSKLCDTLAPTVAKELPGVLANPGPEPLKVIELGRHLHAARVLLNTPAASEGTIRLETSIKILQQLAP